MNSRLKVIGVMLAVIGLAFIAGGGFAYYKTDQGAKSLQAFSAAQNVKLNYNEAGQLVDRGETAGAQAIMSLLASDWAYAVNPSELNPNDPMVNTASEYMYQLATITYHTLHGSTTVVLDEDVTADDGTVYAAGTYEFQNDGRYWTGFDRSNPIEGCRARADLDPDRTRPHRRAWRRRRDRLDPPGRPGHGCPLRRHRRHGPPHRPRPGVGDASPDRAGQGSGPATGDLALLAIQVPTDAPGPPARRIGFGGHRVPHPPRQAHSTAPPGHPSSPAGHGPRSHHGAGHGPGVRPGPPPRRPSSSSSASSIRRTCTSSPARSASAGTRSATAATTRRRRSSPAAGHVGVTVSFLVWTGDPGESIVSAAEAENVDLVVVGTHGRGAIGRLLLGSVSEHVVRNAPCPVLVIRPASGPVGSPGPPTRPGHDA